MITSPENGITVSVIVPVLNEEKHIDALLSSLVSQTFPVEEMEWILIDGGSSDRTLEIIGGYADQYPLILLHSDAKGTPHSLNMGIRESRGRYIVRLDAHTVYPPEYIERCVWYLDNTEADNVGGRVNTVADGFIGSAIAEMLSSRFGVGGSGFRTSGRSGYVDTVPFGAFRREVFDRVGLFDETLLRSEDNDLNSRIRGAGGKIFMADDIVSEYRCRDTVGGVLRYGMQNGNALFRTIKNNPHAMSIRHFIPFLFVMSLAVLPLLGSFSPFFFYVLAAELALYLLIDIYFSFFTGCPKQGLITVWLYPLFHISYGIGSLLGLLGIELY